jgi:HAD superfamily hydrolase (TIGR01549 family)
LSAGRGLEAVTLDLDGTLVDSLTDETVATMEIARRLAIEHPGIDAALLVRAYWAAHVRVWTPVLAAPPPTTYAGWDPRPVIARIWEQTLKHTGIDADHALPSLVEDWLDVYVGGCTLFEDVRPAIAVLAPAHKLAIITNGTTRTQRPKIVAGGFDRMVGQVWIAQEFGYGKPHPEIFLAALESMDVRPDRAVHVGDSLYADVSGAQAVGMRTVWINRTGAVPEGGASRPDAVISTMAELPVLLGSL